MANIASYTPVHQRSGYVLGFIALVAFIVGFFFDQINLQILILLNLGVVAGGVVSLPYYWAIRLLLVYLGIEGAAKIITNYNPVIHVGADLLVIALTLRYLLTLFMRRTRMPTEFPPFLIVMALHLGWFLVEFSNPYALGLIPSLAAVKVYVSMLLLYFFGYYLTTSTRRLHAFMGIWVFTIFLNVVTGLIQAYKGPSAVLAISPYYALPLSRFDPNFAARPFGTTAVPGGAAVLMFLGAPLVIYFLVTSRSMIVKALMSAMLPLMGLVLVACQVRANLAKSIIGGGLFIMLAIGRASGRIRRKLVFTVGIVTTILIMSLPYLTQGWVSDSQSNMRAMERSLSIFDLDVAAKARAGTLERVLTFAEMVPLGAGLSRTGPAAGKFADLLAQDRFFGVNTFFSDNFWAATIAEMGIPGSLFLTILIFGILIKGLQGVNYTPSADLRVLQAALLSPLVAIVAGLWNSEGILYNPEAAFFWFFAGALMRLGKGDIT